MLKPLAPLIFLILGSLFFDPPICRAERTFLEVGSFPGLESSAADWGDFNNDGKLDLLMCGRTSTGQLRTRIYRNDGGGTFTDISASLTPVSQGSVRWGDFNNDNYPDILLTGINGSGDMIAKVYRNVGGQIFEDINAALTGVYTGSGEWGDYNQDGYLDVLITGWKYGG